MYGRRELHAALHRKLREGELTSRHLDIILRQLSVDESVKLWEWSPLSIPIMAAIADTFSNLPRSVFLRTGDAVRLLSAREFGCTAVYSNDRHLPAEAPHVGMTSRDVIEPLNFPEQR